MAIEIATEYTNAIAPDANYPFGSYKNATTPTSFDGTPLEKVWCNDYYGFFSKLLNDTGITPSGVADTILASDYFNAMEMLFERSTVFADSGSADTYELDSTRGSAANPAAYFNGQLVIFKAATTNTGASTIEIGSLGAIALERNGVALDENEISAGAMIAAVYDSTAVKFNFVSSSEPGGMIQKLLFVDISVDKVLIDFTWIKLSIASTVLNIETPAGAPNSLNYYHLSLAGTIVTGTLIAGSSIFATPSSLTRLVFSEDGTPSTKIMVIDSSPVVTDAIWSLNYSNK